MRYLIQLDEHDILVEPDGSMVARQMVRQAVEAFGCLEHDRDPECPRGDCFNEPSHVTALIKEVFGE